MKLEFRKLTIAATLCFVVACNKLDPYPALFQKIEIGDTRTRVIELMGSPTTTNSTEVPLISTESLTWKSPANSRSYVVRLVSNRVLSKAVSQ